MSTWPATLPGLPLGLEDMKGDGRIRTEMGVGPPKMRRRSTARPRRIPVQIEVDGAQRTTLETFHDDTLGAVEPFDWKDPHSGATVSFRFTQQPTFRHRVNESTTNGRRWIALLLLEILP